MKNQSISKERSLGRYEAMVDIIIHMLANGYPPKTIEYVTGIANEMLEKVLADDECMKTVASLKALHD